MSSSLSSSRTISFLDIQEFLKHDPSHGRLDKVIDSNVTFSAVPDGTGGTRWEARTPGGEALPLFRITITRPAQTPTESSTDARGPVIIDTTTGCYICYEDYIRQESRCVQIPC